MFVPVASLKLRPTTVELPVATNWPIRILVPVALVKLSATIVEEPVETKEPNKALFRTLSAVPAPLRFKTPVPVALVKVSP